MKITKKINELTMEDKISIFFSAFPHVDKIMTDEIQSNLFVSGDSNFLSIFCDRVGYSISIKENYEISLDSSVHPITEFLVVPIFENFLKIKAISIDC